MRSRIPILLYHDLESSEFPNEKTNLATRGTVVQHHQFETQLRYLSENGYQAISLCRFFQIKNDLKPQNKKIIITFDDGRYSHYHIAFKLLLQYNFTGTFFIIADKIDQPYYLTTSQIREMADAAMEIGSHGVSHDYLPLLSPDQIEEELKRSKAILEDITDNGVNFFAYPGGHYNKLILQQLRSANYAGACSCLQGLNSGNTDPFFLRRLEVRSNVSIHDFQNYFNQRNIFYYQLIDNTKRMLRAAVGLNSYSKLRQKLYKLYIFKR